MYKLLGLFWLILLPISLNAQLILGVDLHFEGKIRRTDPNFLRQHLLCRVGIPFDPQLIVQDEQFLKNLGIFYGVWSDVRTDETGNRWITFHLEEGLTLLPQLRFNSDATHPDVQFSIQENHLGGRANQLRVSLRHYDRLSAEVNTNFPYLYENWGFAAEVGIKRTNEPLFLSETVAYKVNIPQYKAFLTYNLLSRSHRAQWQISAGGGLLHESYRKIDASQPGPSAVEYAKTLWRLESRFHQEQVVPRHRAGNRFVAQYEKIRGDGSFQKLSLENQFAKRLGNSTNFLFRNQIALATRKNSPFQPFVLDNYENVRGVGNRVRRGNGAWVFNTELRHDFWLWTRSSVQGVAFSDIAFWQSGDAPLSTAFRKENRYIYAGVGLRLYFRKIFDPVFRIDYAFNGKNLKEGAFVFGSGHYF